MKNKVLSIISIIISIFILLSLKIVSAAGETEDYIKEYKDSIYHMSKMMRCIPKTGSIDLDYLYEIAMLSEGEVEFSEAYIKYATCDEIKSVASNYIERETAAIEDMKSLMESLKDKSEKNEDMEEKYLKIYTEQLNNMICRFQKVELTENIDINFLKFISIHHEGVKAITDEFLKMSNDNQVKEVAYKISNAIKSDMEIINKFI